MGQDGHGLPLNSIPDFELIRRIGEGAFGDVWLARNVLGGYRAVKVVFRRKSGAHHDREFDGIRLFAEVCLGNPGQLAVLHVGKKEELGFFYYVMELADDVVRRREIDAASYEPLTLEAERRRRRHTVEETIRIGVALGESLAFLHVRGLVHRDVKPSNVVVVGGVYKLADVGLMEAAATDPAPMGTEGYVPQEGGGTPSVDLFALGKVLYELVNGKDRLEFPSLAVDVPTGPGASEFAALNQIILKACDPDPKVRYATVQEMVEDLRLLLIPRVQRTMRRLRTVTGLSGALAVVAGVVASVTVWEMHRLAEQVYGARLNQANLALAVTKLPRARALLDSVTNNLIDARGFEWYALRNDAEGDPAVRLQGSGPDILALRFHPDGRRLLGYAPGERGKPGTLIEWEISSFESDLQGGVRSPSRKLTVDREPVGLDHRGQLWFLDRRDQVLVGMEGGRSPLPTGGATFHAALTQTPFQDLFRPGIAWALGPGQPVEWWTLRMEGVPEVQLRQLAHPGWQTNETPFRVVIGDGAEPRYAAAVIRGRNHNAEVDILGGAVLGEGRTWRYKFDARVIGLQISPDGQQLAVLTGGAKDLLMLDMASGGRLWEAGRHFSQAMVVEYAPGGDRLATGGDDAVVAVTRAEDGRLERRFVGLGGKVRALAWDARGDWLAASAIGGEVRVFRTRSRPRPRELDGFSTTDGGGMAFSADSKWVALSNTDDSISVVQLEDTSRVERVPGIFCPLAVDGSGTIIGYNKRGHAVEARPGQGVIRVGARLLPEGNPILEISDASAVGPGRRWILAGGTDGMEVLVDPFGSGVIWADRVPPTSGRASNPSMVCEAARVDRAILGHRWGTFRIVDTSVGGGRKRVIQEGGGFGRLQDVYIAPDGTWYALASESGRIGVAKVGAVVEADQVVTPSELYSIAHVSAGGRLIGGTGTGEVQIYSMWPLEPVTLMTGISTQSRFGLAYLRQLAVSPDEQWLAARSAAGTLRLWNLR